MPAPESRKLPIGIQTFREVREENCYYVDKTAYLGRLMHEGKHYFLSRPRRFGKSLFLDTLKELFEGTERLFRGLDIHDDWNWSVRHPVLRLDFSRGNYNNPDHLQTEVMEQLDAIEKRAGVSSNHSSAPARFAGLIEALHERSGQRVAVLIDEYDKPILDALQTPQTARANRDYLHGLYSTIKFADAHIKFTFLTGVSRFSKVNLFSGLNNLIDISLEAEFSAICGYTDEDLGRVFAPELDGVDRDAVRDWYNGYNWRGAENVYNPYDILLFFRNHEFHAWWFETGTPSFLIDMLSERRIGAPMLDHMVGTGALLSTFDVDDMATEALLFQTGYLTIKSEEDLDGMPFYRLGYPNREVRQSLNERLLRKWMPDASRQLMQGVRLHQLLRENDFTGLEALFRAFFSSIPYEWHTNNDIARYEGYYASIFYSHFASVGLDVRVEDSSSHGRLDMAVLFGDAVYLFEFKVVELEPEGAAMAQLQAKGYADKYRDRGGPIHLIAVEFSKESRNLVAFETAPGQALST